MERRLPSFWSSPSPINTHNVSSFRCKNKQIGRKTTFNSSGSFCNSYWKSFRSSSNSLLEYQILKVFSFHWSSFHLEAISLWLTQHRISACSSAQFFHNFGLLLTEISKWIVRFDLCLCSVHRTTFWSLKNPTGHGPFKWFCSYFSRRKSS